MKIHKLISLAFLVTACSSNKPSEKCVYQGGDLLFSKKKANWQEVYIGEKYTDTVLVYNPTKKEIRLESFSYIPEITCRKIGYSEQDWNFGGNIVKPNVCDTLIMTLCLKNESMLGNYYNVMRFMIDGEVDYDYGFMIDVYVRERFKAENGAELRQAPSLVVDTTECDFGILQAGQDAEIVFRLKNAGNHNLIIRKIETTCGCTAVLPEKRVLLPDKEMNLNVVFHSKGRKGKQHKTITLFCNDPFRPVLQFIIKGEVL